MNGSILQILPRAPGTIDGVGDYAGTLASRLRADFQIDSVFVARETAEIAHEEENASSLQNEKPSDAVSLECEVLRSLGDNVTGFCASIDRSNSPRQVDGFPVFPIQEFSRARVSNETCNGVILHYVNYGFQKRGVPLALVSLLQTLRGECGGALLVIFHELFASGPPWRSEFWLRGLQKKIVRNIARLADARLVSCETNRRQLARLAPRCSAAVQPVTSTWGEPALEARQLRERDPHCWLICGGTALVERSLRAFLRTPFPPEVAPRKLFVVGGVSNPHVRAMLNAPAPFTSEYFPAVSPAEAAPIFSQAAFAWSDYFSSPKVPADVLLKSSTFAGFCAHGVVSVLPRVVGQVSIDGDKLPVPFAATNMPDSDTRADAAVATYEWYHRRASAAVLSRLVAQQLQLA